MMGNLGIVSGGREGFPPIRGQQSQCESFRGMKEEV